MFSLMRMLAYPMISLVLLILGSGLFTTFVSVRLELAGSSPETIGLIASAFYSGILLGSIRSPAWIARIGHLRSLVALCAANSALILLHALWIDPLFWGFLRFCSGFVMGALFVVIESWFLLSSDSSVRSRSLSLYLFIFYIALSIGQLLLNVADPQSLIPYCLASTLSSLSILPIVISSVEIPAHSQDQRLPLTKVFSNSPRGFLGGVASGMLLASIYGLGPVYGQAQGFSISDVATLMAVIVFGGVSLQWPLGKWADLFNRRKVLAFACFAAAIFSYLIASIEGASWTLRLVLLWLFGGFSFVLYPLSMTLTCEGIQEQHIVSATGGFVLLYGLGAIAGPLIAPLFMNWVGSAGLFYFLAGVCLLMGLIGSVPCLRFQKPE